MDRNGSDDERKAIKASLGAVDTLISDLATAMRLHRRSSRDGFPSVLEPVTWAAILPVIWAANLPVRMAVIRSQ